MSEADVSRILRLPIEERLRLAELIWESIALHPSSLPLSDAHRSVIDDRLEEHRRNPDDVLTLDQVLSEVRRAG